MDKSTKDHVEGLRKRRQKIAFDANVQRIFNVDTPHAIKCLAEYQRLTAEIDRLDPPTEPPPSPSGWTQMPLL